jgi:hypothetical protein
MLLAIPPSFAEIAILGYIDFASIVVAISVTIIATGIHSSSGTGEFVKDMIPWSAWPKEGITFSAAIVATNNIVFTYSFAGCLPSFMEDMHTPEDYVKRLWWMGGIQIVVYTLTGSIIYAFVGQGVQSPALLSAWPVISRVGFWYCASGHFYIGVDQYDCCAGIFMGRYIGTRLFAMSTRARVG